MYNSTITHASFVSLPDTNKGNRSGGEKEIRGLSSAVVSALFSLFSNRVRIYMEDITLQALLEAGCHFGHKAERWHPKAASYIYTKKDGVHIIDLAKTKEGLERGVTFIRQTVAAGGEVLFVGTKRQARGVVKEAVSAVGAPYLVQRWIGGFLTNWESVRKNIEKINQMTDEEARGAWKKFPKHEQSKLTRYLERLKMFYGGVLQLSDLPAVLFIVDIKKEDAAVREAKRRGIPIVAIVDTNTDPTSIDYVIPANDDAVGSIGYIVQIVAAAYGEGKKNLVKNDKEVPSVSVTKDKNEASGKRRKPRKGAPTATPENT